MHSQLRWAARAFYFGLVLMLAAGMASALLSEVGRWVPLGVTLVGATLAVAAKGWIWRVRCRSRQFDAFEGYGGYPMQILRDPRFMSD